MKLLAAITAVAVGLAGVSVLHAFQRTAEFGFDRSQEQSAQKAEFTWSRLA
jgi:hypothetical protein